MRAGKLRDQIMLQEKVKTGRDAVGGDVFEWTTRADVRCAVQPLSGTEYFSLEQVQQERRIRFTIRYWADVNEAWRVVWEGEAYDIIEILDPDGEHVEQQIVCKTQQHPTGAA